MTWIIIIAVVCVLIFWKMKSRNTKVSYMVPKEMLEFPQIFSELDGHDLLIKRIIFIALFYRSKVSNDINKSTEASLEFIYFLLHIVDRQLFSLHGADKRDEIYDEFSNKIIVEFSDALLKKNTPMEVKMPLVAHTGIKMLDDLNKRQEIYAQCQFMCGEKFPSAGTMIFALAFYIHKALGKTNIDNVDDVLVGEKKIEMEDLVNFPSITDVLALCIYMTDIILKLEVDKCLKMDENKNDDILLDKDYKFSDEYTEMTDEELDAELADLDDEDFKTDGQELKRK